MFSSRGPTLARVHASRFITVKNYMYREEVESLRAEKVVELDFLPPDWRNGLSCDSLWGGVQTWAVSAKRGTTDWHSHGNTFVRWKIRRWRMRPPKIHVTDLVCVVRLRPSRYAVLPFHPSGILLGNTPEYGATKYLEYYRMNWKGI